MKKVGIVTIHKINNYGALEQAYALNRYLRNIGYDAKTIDFRTYRVKESYKIFYPFHSVMDIPRNLQALLYSGRLHRRKKRFDNFLSEMVPMTEKAYFSNDELKKADLDFDYYVCGSDQIWNTYCRNYDPAFILDFAENKGSRISYAASVGALDINEDVKADFCKHLRDYKAISVRESNVVEVISDISGQQVEHVVDPVFLLDQDEWKKISPKNKIKKPYIFFYAVHGDLPGMRAYAQKLSQETGLPIVVVSMNLREMLYSNIKCYDAGPKEFVSLIENAEYVFTNSFHATAFSIIFKKKFLVFADTSKERGAGTSRMHSILNACGIPERLSNENSTVEDMKRDIDYDMVYEKLMPMIEKSKDFLKTALDYKEKIV